MPRAHDGRLKSAAQMELSLSRFEVGDRIELSPATDRWMSGDRYGEIVKIGARYLRVKMDRSGGIAMVHPDNVQYKITNGEKTEI